jgi:hypothetical protein
MVVDPKEITEGSSGPGITQDEARELTSAIQSGLSTVFELVERAWRMEAWRALGYGNWSDYCRAEFGERLPISAEKRNRVINALTIAGMSERAIEAAIDVSRETVRRELAVADTNVSPQPTEPEPEVVIEYDEAELDKLRQVDEILQTVSLPKGRAKDLLAAISRSTKRIRAGEGPTTADQVQSAKHELADARGKTIAAKADRAARLKRLGETAERLNEEVMEALGIDWLEDEYEARQVRQIHKSASSYLSLLKSQVTRSKMCLNRSAVGNTPTRNPQFDVRLDNGLDDVFDDSKVEAA